MKKMNKTYEAPVAELIEMQMPTVLMGSVDGNSISNSQDNPLS